MGQRNGLVSGTDLMKMHWFCGTKMQRREALAGLIRDWFYWTDFNVAGRENALDVKKAGLSNTERQNWLIMVGLGS